MIMEEKKSIGARRLGMLERTGLLLTAPMLHIHYSKLDRGDMCAVLSRKYDPDDNSAAGNICKVRRARSPFGSLSWRRTSCGAPPAA
jgi:hypothetical protein